MTPLFDAKKWLISHDDATLPFAHSAQFDALAVLWLLDDALTDVDFIKKSVPHVHPIYQPKVSCSVLLN